jgi:mannobiose 2-epimerase
MDNTRLLWSYSAAYGYFGKREYLLAASKTRDRFINIFTDHKFGGVFWSVKENGERTDTTIRLSALGSAIYALSEFHKSTGDEEALKAAINLYNITEKEFRTEKGYREAATRDFRFIEEQEKAESILILLEGYANLYSQWRQKGLKADTVGLINLLKTDDLNITGKLEASWSLLADTFIMKDFDLINRIKPFSYRFGKSINCPGQYLNTKIESVIADLWLWKYHNDTYGAARAMKTWKSIMEEKDNVIASCPSRGVRMCIQCLRIFD